jgi:dynein heavy chain, axonemal
LILSDFPDPFDIEEARKKYPSKREEGMNTVLVQELNRYNNLINLVRHSLMSIKDALNG